MINYFQTLCEKENIQYQDDFLLCITIANILAIVGIGVLSGGLSIPCRYTIVQLRHSMNL